MIDAYLDWVTANKIEGGLATFATGFAACLLGDQVKLKMLAVGLGLKATGGMVAFTGVMIFCVGLYKASRQPGREA